MVINTVNLKGLLSSLILGIIIFLLPLHYGACKGIFANESSACNLLLLLSLLGLPKFIQQFWSKRTIGLNTIDYIIGICSLYGIYSYCTHQNTDPYILYRWGAALIVYWWIRSHTLQLNIILVASCLSGTIQAILAIGQIRGWLASPNAFFQITGSFENPGPLGGYIAITWIISLGLLLYTIKKSHKIGISLLLLSLTIQSYGLYLTDSRAAWVASLSGFICFIGFYNLKKINIFFQKRQITKITLAFGLFCIIVGLIYNYRPTSANARLLIGRISINMIADSPIFGHGPGSFSKKYMLYQADYFKQHPDTEWVLIADNVIYPFNELIGITAEYGILGLFLIFYLLYLTFTFQSQTTESQICKSALFALLIFSLFSYPSDIFPLWIFYALFIGCINNQNIKSLTIPRLITIFILIAISISMIWIIQGKTRIERVSASLFLLYQGTDTIKDKDYERMKHNSIFNDYYMTWLSKQSQLESHLKKRIKDILPSCEGFCHLGNSYMEQNKFIQAEYYYRWASYMIPTRMQPQYLLWQLYVTTGEKEKARRVAHTIIEMPLKVENTYTLKIKRRMKEYLSQKH